MAFSPTIDARASAILTRVIQPDNGNLSPAAARALLGIQLDPQDRERLHELQVKNRDDRLTAEERSELHSYLYVGLVLDVLQAKARAALHGAKGRRAQSHGGSAASPGLAARPRPL